MILTKKDNEAWDELRSDLVKIKTLAECTRIQWYLTRDHLAHTHSIHSKPIRLALTILLKHIDGVDEACKLVESTAYHKYFN